MLAYYLHHLDPIIFRIYDNVGPRWYGLAYVLAFVSSYLVFLWLVKRGYADLPPQKVGDFITGCALFGVIIGGRLGYVFFYKPEMLREPLSILRVWEGGMSSHGGMLGLLLFTLYYARRHNISWLNLGDNLVVPPPVGLLFRRCANCLNGEPVGRIGNSFRFSLLSLVVRSSSRQRGAPRFRGEWRPRLCRFGRNDLWRFRKTALLLIPVTRECLFRKS